MTRSTGIVIFVLLASLSFAQGDKLVRAKADAYFADKDYVAALPLYSQLVSLSPGDRVLNYQFGTCLLFGGTDRDKAIGHLKFATQDPSIPPDAWYWLGRAYHLSYQFKDALTAYQRYQGTGSKKELEGFPIASLDKQCRNGMNLLSNLKEITVHGRVEADDSEFFRFYELGDIGGRIVVLPEELKSSLDKKSKRRSLVYLPEKGGPIYFASYGKDGKAGLDIYRTELLTNGTFATPVKLAGYVNSDQDEDYAFMHPDGRSFYFSSKGHNSMGGYDVFRSAYDKASETFGPPENLDFAVNTPDDELLYITDAGNEQACFASGRSSQQGKLHVYRVATAQVPVVVTVMKGTFASTIDKNDRQAHIMVEDAVTRERVADVRTDINGSYVLAFPRSGRFRYLVECGPSGRTHTGTVDVPRTTSARAFRQELELRGAPEPEVLVIRNYFDEPLEEDMIALMMEEIKRRARLDVTGDKPKVEAPVTLPLAEGDLLTQAGFAGDMTEEKAVELARADAKQLADQEKNLGEQRMAAFTIARDAAAAAEQAALQATASVEKANAATNEEERNSHMREAAQQRQRSRTADLRARAAYRTARDLGTERTAVQARATEADRAATALSGSIAAGDKAATLANLRTLKARLDTKAGPDGDLSFTERVRRDLAEQEKEAARSLNQATAKRAEETEFADRIDRAKRERDAAKGNSRKEELGRIIAEQEQQLVYLHAEVEAAFNAAQEQLADAAVERGQHSLLQHLSTQALPTTGTPPTNEEVAGLGQRIAGIGTRIGAIQVDSRFDGNFTEPAATVEARSFNWQITVPDAALATATTPTRTMNRDGTNDAVHADNRTTIPARNATGEVQGVEVPQVPVSTGEELANADRMIGEVKGSEARTDEPAPGSNAQANAQVIGNAPAAEASTTTEGNNVAVRASDHPAVNNTTPRTTPTTSDPTTMPADVASAGSAGEVTVQQGAASQTTGSATTTTEGTTTTPAMTEFLVENERAELQQAIAAERNAARRAELETRLKELEVRASETPGTIVVESEAELSLDGVDMQRTPLTFFPADKDEGIIATLYADYDTDKARLAKVEDPAARADGLSGLELMLADSMRAEMVRQAAILELAPQQGEVILPRIERLRQIRQAHIQEAERIQEAATADALATAPSTEGLPRHNPRATFPVGEDPIADRFIHINSDPQEVYASKVDHRSHQVAEAVELKMADLARMEELDHRIDSLEEAMVGLPRKEFDRERRKADKLIDERMIIRSELGQRSSYLTKEEWRTSTDSLKRLDVGIDRIGFAPNEPLLVMSEDLRNNAKARFDEAATLRKKADRTEDIMLRDSLLRSAYGMELEALGQMDRAITVKTYLVGGGHQRGETLAYEEVARRVLGLPEEPLLASGSNARKTSAETGSITSEPTTTERTTAATTTEPDRSVNTTEVAVSAVTTTAAEPPTGMATPGSATGSSTMRAGTGVEGTITDEQSTGAVHAVAQADVNKAREAAMAMADSTERTLPRTAQNPASRYEHYMQAETAMLKVEALDPAFDPDLIALKKEQAIRESADLEQRSLSLTDRAASMADSATTARKRDRQQLEQLAVRTRFQADSLHERSLAVSEQARSLELQQRDAVQAKVLRDRLVKYYYLTSEEQSVVLDDEDLSRYFQMKARALEQLDAASEAEAAARVNRQLSEVLRKETTAVEQEERGGRISNAEAMAKRAILYDRAERLSLRADSLSNVAARLRGAANINESQAGVLMQGMPAERSTEWMAMEMRTRRTEAQLARSENAMPAAADRMVEAPTTSTRMAPTMGTTPPGTRQITAPFGTDPAAAAVLPTKRPIAEIPAGNAPAMVFPTVLENDIFAIRPTAERQPVTIAMDAAMPTGIVFKVQIGAFRSAISEDVFNDMTPVMGEHTTNGFIRYTAGLFTGFQQAARAKDQVRDRGYRDAFVVAYRDGVRIPLGEAMRAARVAEQAAVATIQPTSDPADLAVAPGMGTPQNPTPGTGTPPTTTQRDAGHTVLEPVRTDMAITPSTTVLIQRPVELTATAAPAQARTTEDILARYPATAEAIVGAYAPAADATAYYNVPGAAPATQVESIKGLFYTVQVGVYSKPVPLGKLYNIAPLNSERTETAKVRYTTGRYSDTEKARVRKEEAVMAGVKDAFVTAYLNGKRIPMQEAAVLLERYGAAILAQP